MALFCSYSVWESAVRERVLPYFGLLRYNLFVAAVFRDIVVLFCGELFFFRVWLRHGLITVYADNYKS